MKRGKLLLGVLGALLIVVSPWPPAVNAADAPTGGFNLQVSPSPLVTTVKPGTKTSLELKIRNGGSSTEHLKIEPREFTFNSETGQVDLSDATPPAIASWMTFSQPRFAVAPGQWVTQRISFDVPADAGFSYSFALVVSRQEDPKLTEGGRLIKGAVAVFTLVNVDRPGAKSSLQVISFKASKNLYEYLPAQFDVRLRNTGNTIVQPYGNIFVQRKNTAKDPLATLAVNETKGYILPGTERALVAVWNEGFATYQPADEGSGKDNQRLQIDWSKLSQFRIGRYTAKLVAVYNDGQHAVPIEGTVTFWVVPWRAILLLTAVVVGLWFLGRWRNKRRTEKAVRRALATQAAAKQPPAADKPKNGDAA